MTPQNVRLNSSEVVHWFNAIRNVPQDQRYRVLEGMWDTQIQSKAWLINVLNYIMSTSTQASNVYVFGGWIGILSSMLFQSSTFPIGKIRSIDLDPQCEHIADTVCKPHEMNDWRFKAVTADMKNYVYQSDLPPHIVINTSAEHVDQQTYDAWYDRIPVGTLVVVQGNNYFSCAEHVRCSSSLEEFMQQNCRGEPLWCDDLPNPQYTRYMCVWRK